MGEFFDGLDAADEPVPADERVAAALGPKMLDLSAERSLGAHPYFTPVEHTRSARERLGPGPLLAPEVTVVVEPDDERAREHGREFAVRYLERSNYRRNLLRLGFEDGDFEGGGSDRLIDAVIPHGSAEQVADAVPRTSTPALTMSACSRSATGPPRSTTTGRWPGGAVGVRAGGARPRTVEHCSAGGWLRCRLDV